LKTNPSTRELTARESQIFEKYREAHAATGTRMKLVRDDEGQSRIIPDHEDNSVGHLVLADALGAADLDFSNGLVVQLARAGAKHNEIDVEVLNFMLSVVKGIEPRDQVESMLAAQMAGIHVATMQMMRQLAVAESGPQMESAERGLNRLARTFAAQMEALKRYRTGGEKVTVQRVSVSEGGQAIVGNVTQASRENAAERTSPQLTQAKHAPINNLGAEEEVTPEPVAASRKRAKSDGKSSA
jgi:hypothetical protein